MDARLRKIEQRVKEYQDAQRFTVFVLEDGSLFQTREDSMAYLIQHGVETPRGRIVAYPHPTEGVDELSQSLYELIDDGVKKGGLQWLLDDLEGEDEH